jgi:putative addiction module component (TIGR02574 family)
VIKPTLRKTVRALPVEDRIELLEELSHSIAADQRDLPLQPWQRKVIGEQEAAYGTDAGSFITHGEFKKKVQQAVKKLRKQSGAKPRS